MGVDYNDNREKEKTIQNLNNSVQDFYPSGRKGEIKIYFIPIKNCKNKFMEGLHVIKIIVPQDNVKELYSIVNS